MNPERKNPFLRVFESIRAERFYENYHRPQNQRPRLELLRHALRGLRVWLGSKKPRKDALAVVMEKTFEGLLVATGSAPTAKEVLRHLKDYDECDELGMKDTIQEITEEDEVCWIDRRGREQTTSLRAFRNRLTAIRKRHHD